MAKEAILRLPALLIALVCFHMDNCVLAQTTSAKTTIGSTTASTTTTTTATNINTTTTTTAAAAASTSASSDTGKTCNASSDSTNKSPAFHGNYSEVPEYHPFDGWYNNFAHPEWGAAETALLRLLPPAYGDGVYAPSGANRPNPLDIARVVFDGPTGLPSYRNRTAFLVFFGQQLVEEILDAQGSGCPPEYFNIPIPKGHPLFDPEGEGGRELPLLRTRYDARTGFSPNVPREQLNEVSSFFDGTLMYGPNKAWSDVLRSFKDGLMKALNDTNENARYFPAVNIKRLPYANPPPPRDHYLKPVKRFYTIGNPRGNENPFLLTMGVMWFRYHNFKARQLKHGHPTWNDERLFNEARKWVIATHQKIVYYEWFPAWLNETLPAYDNSYNPNIHPQIAHVFQSAAMRFGHTLVPPGVFRRKMEGEECVFINTTLATHFAGKAALRTCNTYWNPQEAIDETDIDQLIMGMVSQIAEREDNIVTPDLHGNVFGPLEFSRRDLMAVNIQRGRDHGLPDYNTAREFFGLKRITCWEDINPALFKEKPDIFGNLSALYNNSLDDLDIWPAGMLETTERGPGELFRTIIKNQFLRIRNGDRFWFENYKQNKLFTEEEFREIMNTTILDVILAVTNISRNHIQTNPFFHLADDPCPQPFQLSHLEDHMENCTEVKSYDYFYGSEVSYALTLLFILGSLAPIIGVLFCLAYYHKKTVEYETENLHKSRKRRTMLPDNAVQVISAIEWIGDSEGERVVTVQLDATKRRIVVKEGRQTVRAIELTTMTGSDRVAIVLAADQPLTMMLVRVPGEYDLVLDFERAEERNSCLHMLNEFFRSLSVSVSSPSSIGKKQLKQTAITKAKRQKTLEAFFNAVVSYALKYDTNRTSTIPREGSEVLRCELTRYEFAEALSMQPDSLFVENMFRWVDKSGNGTISFREFLDFFVIFAKGDANAKMKLLFDMYDINETGKLTKADFKTMLRSMVELANETIEDNKISQLADSLFQKSGLDQKTAITFEDFQGIVSSYRDELELASLDIKVGDVHVNAKRTRENATTRARRTIFRSYEDDDESPKHSRLSTIREVQTIQRAPPMGKRDQLLTAFANFMSNNRLQIFWATLFTLVVFGIFIERCYLYATEREHTGLRQICGYGVSITRGAANVEMFCFSVILLTMCRNLITFLRDTPLHRYIPFDNAVDMHKLIAFWGTAFTLVHIIGHCFNFYHISTQPASDLACIFRNFFHPTDFLPKFQKWCWTTITGLTAMGLTLQYFMIAVFSTQYARRHCYRGFWLVHNTYPIFYILMIMHGCGRLVQPPFFYYFFLGPVIVFVLDMLVSLSRKKIEIVVVKAELLPSEVTLLQIKRPNNFQYKSGQWVRIACLGHNKREYHPFTLTSAPHEEYITLHIRAVGPWTFQIRRLYDPRLIAGNAFPKIYLDGPFGEGHQDWHRHEVAVLIGAGIGVTPYASILKDIAHLMASGGRMACKKIYFLWVTRTQRHFEWMTDIIREVEAKDTRGIVSAHIFITQFKEKFDIRTTMLYICERHFQKISERSLFTGLKSVTHFGRPDFEQFFKLLIVEHQDTSVFGVFSCGPPSLTNSVDKACSQLNKYTRDVLFEHSSENI